MDYVEWVGQVLEKIVEENKRGGRDYRGIEGEICRTAGDGYDLANVYVGLGEKDQAFAWLEKDFQSRSSVLPYWLNLPPLNSLRDDPRFKDLARRMGLPELK